MREKIVISAAVAATTAGLIASYAYWRRRRMPTEWTQIGTLENIYMSPVKSGFLVEHNEAVCEIAGLTGTTNKRLRDRCFVVMNSPRRYISGRSNPLVTQIKCDIKDNEATFSFVLNNDIRPLTFNLDELEARKPTKVHFGWCEKVKRWVKAVDCGDESSEWLKSCIIQQDHLNDSSKSEPAVPRLLYFVDDSYCRDQRGLFFEDTSYMLITQKSLEDLNSRLNVPVSMRNFRPNFVVSGTSKPFEEDSWKWVKIGDAVFEYVKPCIRCSFTTIDPDTGVKDKEMEPLKTLKSYRQLTDPVMRRAAGEDPVFGANYGLRSTPGIIVRKGDPVYVSVN